MIGVQIPFLSILAVVIIVNFLISLPISISGIGIREGGYITLLKLYGIDESMSLVLSLLDFALYVIPVLIGSLLFISSGIRVNKLREKIISPNS